MLCSLLQILWTASCFTLFLSGSDNSNSETLLSTLNNYLQFIETYQAVYLIHTSSRGTMMNLAYFRHFPPMAIYIYADSSKITGKKKIIYIDFFLKEILKNKPKSTTAPNTQELKQIQPARFRKFYTRPGHRCLCCLPTLERTGRNLSHSG